MQLKPAKLFANLIISYANAVITKDFA